MTGPVILGRAAARIMHETSCLDSRALTQDFPRFCFPGLLPIHAEIALVAELENK
jgi:hypothetical protein